MEDVTCGDQMAAGLEREMQSGTGWKTALRVDMNLLFPNASESRNSNGDGARRWWTLSSRALRVGHIHLFVELWRGAEEFHSAWLLGAAGCCCVHYTVQCITATRASFINSSARCWCCLLACVRTHTCIMRVKLMWRTASPPHLWNWITLESSCLPCRCDKWPTNID